MSLKSNFITRMKYIKVLLETVYWSDLLVVDGKSVSKFIFLPQGTFVVHQVERCISVFKKKKRLGSM